mmetsp:Transcript_16041/g.50286  ORF Transcript_16041/g.50286 Transcript_16041/m.50286 type:complete len:222 (-) Transcript_16041:168-833(-)
MHGGSRRGARWSRGPARGVAASEGDGEDGSGRASRGSPRPDRERRRGAVGGVLGTVREGVDSSAPSGVPGRPRRGRRDAARGGVSRDRGGTRRRLSRRLRHRRPVHRRPRDYGDHRDAHRRHPRDRALSRVHPTLGGGRLRLCAAPRPPPRGGQPTAQNLRHPRHSPRLPRGACHYLGPHRLHPRRRPRPPRPPLPRPNSALAPRRTTLDHTPRPPRIIPL